METKIEISVKTILLVILVLAALAFLWQIRGVLFIVAVAYLIASAMAPFVNSLQSRMPRTAAILVAYLIVICVLVGIGTLIIPPLISESTRFYARFPGYFEDVSSRLQIDTSVLNRNIEQIGANLLKITLEIVSNTVELITIFVISVYLSFERKNFPRYLISLLGEKRGERTEKIMELVEERIGRWIRGQLTLCLMIGVATYIGLALLRFPYAVPLAVIAGLLEAVPNVGPIVSAIPAVIIGFSESPFMGLVAIALYTLIQQLENHIVVPRVMSHVAGLPPLAIIIVLLIGGSLMGTVGVILAIPAFLVAQTVLGEITKK